MPFQPIEQFLRQTLPPKLTTLVMREQPAGHSR